MRLNELALHSWDARVALDPHAALLGDTAEVLIEQLVGYLGFMIGFVGKADALAEPAVVEVEGSKAGIVIAEKVALTDTVTDPTATFTGPLEAVIRLLAGRLDAAHTPAGVDVTGGLTLDDLRRVFPGY